MLRFLLPRTLAVASTFSIAFSEPSVAAPPAVDTKVIDPNISIISGTANLHLSQKIVKILNKNLTNVTINKFSDGEININIKESLRGKDVFIIQTCSPPVNESIMELLLSVAAAKRSGATTVTAVIPYFGYKLNRRGLPISTTHHSRFLWNAAYDLAKMLNVTGVDKVISVDLQRPGQGHEACFFKATLPAETISTNDLFVDYFRGQFQENGTTGVAVVSANTEYTKKARKFQKKLSSLRPDLTVSYAVFMRSDAENTTDKGSVLEIEGNVRGKDVILIEDYIVHLTILCNRLMREGARRVYVCASHGHFDTRSMRLIDLSPIAQVVISDSLALPDQSSTKIIQLSIAPLLASVIQSDMHSAEMEFNDDTTDEDFVPE